MVHKTIIVSILTAFFLIFPVAHAFAATNATISTDSVLITDYDTLTITGGTSTNWVEVDMNGHTARCVKLPGQYVRVFNGTVTGCSGHTVFITGQHIVVEKLTVRNSVTENGTTTCGTTNGNWSSAIKAEKGSADVLIRDNRVYQNCGEGIDTTMAASITIEQNIAYDNFSVNYYVDNSNDIIVRNNYSYYTGNTNYFRNGQVGACLLIGAEDYRSYGWSTNRITNILVEGNIMEKCRGISLWNPVATPLVNVVIQNNNFYTINTVLVNVPGATVSNNVLMAGSPGPLPTSALSPTTTPNPLDFDNDTKITIIDFTLYMNYWFFHTINKADLNRDGKISVIDFTIFMNAWYDFLRHI